MRVLDRVNDGLKQEFYAAKFTHIFFLLTFQINTKDLGTLYYTVQALNTISIHVV